MRLPARPLILAAALAAGCGGHGGGAATTGPTATVPAAGVLRVSAREYSLNPARVVVRGPGELRIELRNRGSLPHDARLRRGGRDVGGTPPIPRGHSAIATVALHPGRYELLCTVGDHAQLGMRGVLQVKE